MKRIGKLHFGYCPPWSPGFRWFEKGQLIDATSYKVLGIWWFIQH